MADHKTLPAASSRESSHSPSLPTVSRTTVCHFLRLPAELRLQVYKKVFKQSKIYPVTPSRHCPAIFLINHLISQEAQPLLRPSPTRYILTAGARNELFQQRISPSGLSLIPTEGREKHTGEDIAKCISHLVDTIAAIPRLEWVRLPDLMYGTGLLAIAVLNSQIKEREYGEGGQDIKGNAEGCHRGCDLWVKCQGTFSGTWHKERVEMDDRAFQGPQRRMSAVEACNLTASRLR